MTADLGRDELRTALADLIASQPDLEVDVQAIEESTKIEDIGFDSISILDFMYEIEGKFGIELAVRDLVEMVQVKDLLDHLEGKLAK